MIPQSFIQNLLTRIDLVALINHHVPLKKTGANFSACCPFHSEKTPSFTVSSSKQFYYCFGCQTHGTAISFLMNYLGLSFIDALKNLSSSVGLVLPNQNKSYKTSKETVKNNFLIDLNTRAAQYYVDQLQNSCVAKDYLKSRGINESIAHQFMMGYAPSARNNLACVFDDYAQSNLQTAGLVVKKNGHYLYDRFQDRIIFPIFNLKNEIIAFGGRVLNDRKPKYLNSPTTPIFEKGLEIFGLSQALPHLRTKKMVLVVEGYLDVIALAQHDMGYAVATLGTAVTRSQVQKLLRSTDRIVYCFDGDIAGRKAAWQVLENSLEFLTDQKNINFVFLPEAEDPDSFVRHHGQVVFEQLIEKAIPLSVFLINELTSLYNLTVAEDCAQLLLKAKPLLRVMQAPLLRLQIIKRLAKKTGFSQGEIEHLCELISLV